MVKENPKLKGELAFLKFCFFLTNTYLRLLLRHNPDLSQYFTPKHHIDDILSIQESACTEYGIGPWLIVGEGSGGNFQQVKVFTKTFSNSGNLESSC